MTERRLHWDDGLIAAVDKALWDDTPAPEYVFRIIAAVEDWVIAAQAYAAGLESEIDAEAAIQRVREIRTPSVGLWPERPDAWFNGYAAALEVVLRALDGGAE